MVFLLLHSDPNWKTSHKYRIPQISEIGVAQALITFYKLDFEWDIDMKKFDRGMRTILGLIFNEFDLFDRRLYARIDGRLEVRWKNFWVTQFRSILAISSQIKVGAEKFIYTR